MLHKEAKSPQRLDHWRTVGCTGTVLSFAKRQSRVGFSANRKRIGLPRTSMWVIHTVRVLDVMPFPQAIHDEAHRRRYPSEEVKAVLHDDTMDLVVNRLWLLRRLKHTSFVNCTIGGSRDTSGKLSTTSLVALFNKLGGSEAVCTDRQTARIPWSGLVDRL